MSQPDEEIPNDIDELMARVEEVAAMNPLEYTKRDLNVIIAYQRKQRVLREQGVRTKKPKMEAGPTLSLETLLAALPKAAPAKPASGGMKRRV